MALCSAACFDTTNGFYDPDGNTKDPDHGVYFVRRDNPFLTGRALLGVTDEAPRLPTYSTSRVIEPDGIRVGSDTPGVLRGNEGWAWSDAPVDPDGAMFAATLRLPGVRLPMGGVPVTMTLDFVRHRVRSEPIPPGTNPPPIGFDEGRLDTMEVALDPRVLLLPVRVHRFVRPGAPIFTADRRYFEQTLDVAAVETIDALRESNPFESAVRVVSGRLLPPAVDVDGIFTQCDIQFRLELYEEIPQSDNLETILTNTCICSGSGQGLWSTTSGRPLGPYLAELASPESALEVFVGGAIIDGTNGCGPNTRAVTCGSSNSALGGSCGRPGVDPAIFHDRNFVLLHADAVRTDAGVLAHELGHLIGLTHSPNEGRTQCLDTDDTAGVAGLLMSPGAAGATITLNQCARARCVAAYWLERLGRFTSSQRDAVCAE